MSDFGELCPLFKTGVFGEIVFPGPMSLSEVLTQVNLLAGTGAAAKAGYFTFGRTVVITNAWIQRLVATNTTTAEFWLVHKTSGTAALSGTVFGSISFDVTASQYEVGYTWAPMTIAAEKTFTSDEVLSLQIADNTMTVSSGAVALMVRYKEK